jgi:hypothetical protein
MEKEFVLKRITFNETNILDFYSGLPGSKSGRETCYVYQGLLFFLDFLGLSGKIPVLFLKLE